MKNPDFCSFKFQTVTITNLQNKNLILQQQQTTSKQSSKNSRKAETILRTENEKPIFLFFQISNSHNNRFTKQEFNSSATTDNQQAILQKFQKFRNAETILRTENEKPRFLFFQISDSHNNRFTKPEATTDNQQAIIQIPEIQKCRNNLWYRK